MTVDITERLHNLMLSPGWQSRNDQQTLLDGKNEIERLRAALAKVDSYLKILQNENMLAEDARDIVAAALNQQEPK